MKPLFRNLILALAFIALAWIVDSAIDTVFFHEGTFLDNLFGEVPPVELYMRVSGAVTILAFATVITILSRRTSAALEALQESEERHRAYVEHAPDAVLVVDREGRYIDANEAAARLLGYPMQELLTLSIQDVVPPETLERSRGNFANLKEGGRASFETRFLRKDGSHFVASMDAVRLPEGRYMAFCADITERKRIEDALRESEEKYRGLFEGSRDALMTLSPPSWDFDSCNAATIAMFGARDEAAFLARPPWQYSPERQPDGRDSGEKAQEMIGTAMRKGSHSFEWAHRRADGADFPATVLLTRTEVAGETILQATVRDITERKRLESELLESRDRLRKLSAHLSEVREEERRVLARELHDEVGQGLTAMRWDLDAFKEGPADGPNSFAERVHAMVEIVNDAVIRVNRMSHDLRSPVLELLGIEDAIQAHAEEVQERTELEIGLDLELGELGSSTERDTSILRIFQETLSNVTRHAEAHRAEVSASVLGGNVVLEVRDDGVGISQEQLRDEGSFGLIGMRERAVLVGGTVEIRRDPGGGTSVKAVIPVESA